MNKQKLKVSDLIKNSCCPTTLDVPKNELVKLAIQIEFDNERLTHEVKRLERHNKQNKSLIFVLFVCVFLLLMFY